MKIKRVVKGCLNSLLDEVEKSNKLTNRKALKLLEDMEELGLIRVLKRPAKMSGWFIT